MSKKLVVIENNQALTDSRIVAQKFDKNHRDVLKAIRELISQAGGMRKISQTPMFEETTYINEQNGQSYPMYLMNRDGFSLLAMGFTGKKALQFKIDFINAFNRMEEKFRQLAIDGHDQRWLETRALGKKTRKILTRAIKALEEYFEARGKSFPNGFLYGHITNTIQDALGIKKGSRDSQSVKKLNQLDQAEDISGGIILKSLANRSVGTLAEIDAQILIQLRKLNNLLSGQLFLPD